ncbi:MAG TPA: glutathione-disulfide reductase [Alcanivoracaceae bacterium]|nr:glutathione-disulfide reductase [Alcanivoracaceae bacterium]
MSNTDGYDFIIIGAGSGGVRAARIAAGFGAKVALIENRFFGGTCVNVGCVPKKLFSYAAQTPAEAKLAGSYGFDVNIENFDWPTLRDNKTKEIERLNGIYVRMLENANVKIYEGHGKITGAQQVTVNGEQLHGQHILIATGGKPYKPSIPGIEHALISDDLFYLPELPKRAAIVGGGFIACEYASILNGLGVEVHQLYRGELVLRGFDKDVRQFVAAQMVQNGITIHNNADVHEIQKLASSKKLLWEGGELEIDEIIYATGREPNYDNLFTDNMAPELTDNGKIRVNESFETSIPNIYAVGDVIEGMELTPVALAEGMWLARHLFSGNKMKPLSYEMIPSAVFCEPSIGTIGLTEEEAREKYGDITIYKSDFRPMRYSLSDMQPRTLMKLVVDTKSDRVVGLHMAGDDAGEITQGFAVGMKMGATKADFDATIGIHPTAAEEFVTMRTPVSE